MKIRDLLEFLGVDPVVVAWWNRHRMKIFDWETECPELLLPPEGHVYRIVVEPPEQRTQMAAAPLIEPRFY